jgi:putative oxidoreductase
VSYHEEALGRCIEDTAERRLDVAYGMLFLRVVLGATLFAHGSQKLFGWFGGHGPRGTAGFFGQLGFRQPYAMAIVAGLSEAAGLLLAFGLLTPLAALAIAATMVVAVGSVHWRNGFFATSGGYEFNLLIWACAVTIAATGPGRFSTDGAIGWIDQVSGLWWGVGVALASLVAGVAVLSYREAQPAAEDTDAPLARERNAERMTAG